MKEGRRNNEGERGNNEGVIEENNEGGKDENNGEK